MPKQGTPLHPLTAWVLLGGCLGFLVASFAPLWEVQRPRERLLVGEAGRGSFWDLFGELPSALDSRSTAQDLAAVLDPAFVRARRWRNVRTTLLVLAAGAALGCGVWALRFVRPLTPHGE
jgi:hypothetical protein